MIMAVLLLATFQQVNPSARPTARVCGVDRWAVKTLSDTNAEHVDLTDVTATTIADLNALPARRWAEPGRRHPPEEMTVYEVDGIVRKVKAEADRDVHIVLEDPESPGMTIIVEVADPDCPGARESPHVEALKAARAMLLSLLRLGRPSDPRPLLGRRVRVRGVGFYDFPHGQTGRAKNDLELHPVLAITALD